MTKFEHKIFDFIQKYILLIFLSVVTITGVIIRLCGIDFQSDDYQSFLYSWWVQIKNSGADGLATQIGNYNIPYQIIIYILTLLPFGPLYSYKLISIFFDFVLACSAALVVRSFDNNKSILKSFITYALVFCSMTVVLNSSFWAQCDSIYTSFILLAIYFLKKENHIVSFVLLGISFAFKLQFIFIIPIFLYYYISTRKISIFHFLIIPAVNFIMCLPSVILGRPVSDIFTIYAEQTDYGKLIQMNCPNIYAFMCNGSNTDNYYLLKPLSVMLTITILGMGLVLIIYKKVDLTNSVNFLIASIWTVFTCIMFLSSMHERYSYLLDILLIIYTVITTKRVWLTVACNLISLRGYCYYLFDFYEVAGIKITAVIYVALYAYASYVFITDVIMNGKKQLLQ